MDDCRGPTEMIGWFIDDFLIEPFDSATCTDFNPCTQDICVGGSCEITDLPSCSEGPATCEVGEEKK